MKVMKDYSAYIFDLYGTLADIHTDESKASFWKKVRSFFLKYGIEYPYRDLKKDYLLFCKEEEEKRRGENIEIDLYPVFRDLFEKKGYGPDDRDIRDLAIFFREASRSHLRLYAGAADLLSSLKRAGKSVYLLSNAQALFTNEELTKLGIRDLFDGIVLSSDIGFKKPSVHIFDAFFERYALDRNDCLYIGNDRRSDVKGAHDAGLDVYYIHSALSFDKGSDEKADYEQDHMDLQKLKRRLLSML